MVCAGAVPEDASDGSAAVPADAVDSGRLTRSAMAIRGAAKARISRSMRCAWARSVKIEVSTLAMRPSSVQSVARATLSTSRLMSRSRGEASAARPGGEPGGAEAGDLDGSVGVLIPARLEVGERVGDLLPAGPARSCGVEVGGGAEGGRGAGAETVGV